MKYQKELEQKYKKRLDQEAYDKSRNCEVTEYDKADEDAIRSAMISDNILFYFCKYSKYQNNYQNFNNTDTTRRVSVIHTNKQYNKIKMNDKATTTSRQMTLRGCNGNSHP